jgi:energy-converting hydrogenase Eha subunit E
VGGGEEEIREREWEREPVEKKTPTELGSVTIGVVFYTFNKLKVLFFSNNRIYSIGAGFSLK